jgi:hypothetical protein
LPFYFAHPGILAGKRENPAFATTAIFSRFPNKNPENATLVKSGSVTGHQFKRKGTKVAELSRETNLPKQRGERSLKP